MMALVEIRCRRCRKLLATVEAAPDDWEGAVEVPQCPDHWPGMTGPVGRLRRELGAGYGDYPPVVERTVRVPYARLRPYVEAAWRTSRTQSFRV